MSLAKLVENYYNELEVITEKVVNFNKPTKYNADLKCSIYLDDRGQRSSHGPRVKIIRPGSNSKDHNSGVSVALYNMEITDGEIKNAGKREDVYAMIEFLSRKAIRELLFNLTSINLPGNTINITADDGITAIKNISSYWHPGDPDNYDQDLDVIKSVSPKYNPIPLSNYVKPSKKRK